ncbi:hypothetical protein N9F42_02045 [Pseudomonadales bacterium]|nr:hypothetical protein [Pseudomonadales bacterium]
MLELPERFSRNLIQINEKLQDGVKAPIDPDINEWVQSCDVSIESCEIYKKNDFVFIVAKDNEYFSDNPLINFLGLSDNDSVTSIMRLEFARDYLQQLSECGDQTSIHAFKVSHHQDIFLCYSCLIQGQAGPIYKAVGSFNSIDSFTSWLKEDYFVYADHEDIADDEILSVWARL